MKRVISVVLVVCIMTSILAVMRNTVFAETVSGLCGEIVKWTFNSSTGELSISGNGRMNDYDDIQAGDPAPWYKYKNSIKTITIGNDITYIGSYAFQDMNINSIVIPDSVVEIGEYAFSFCYNLNDVYLSNSLKSISVGMFAFCKGLQYIVIPESVTQIGYAAFTGCSKLKDIVLYSSINTIADSVFPSSLENVYYYGNALQWRKMQIGKGNNGLINANIHYQKEIIDSFSDIKDNAWYTSGVLYCLEHDYLNGTSDTTFAPNAKLNRAMFVTILAKIDGADVEEYTSTSFADVAEGKWYTKTVEWAFKNDYTSGVGTDAATGKPIFGWNQYVTRQQLAVFLYNYSQKKGYDVSQLADLSKYTDAGDVSGWAVTGVRWAIASGMISGTSETTLSPKNTATRAQVALIVMNYVESIERK